MHRHRFVLMLLALALLATSCGARLTDEQKQAALATGGAATGSGAAAGAATGTDTGATGATGTDTGATGATGTDTGATGTGATGTDTGATGTGTPTGDAAACTGGGASDTGVTPTEIKLGNVSTISGPVPGFGQTAQNAVKAYFNYANSTGGVCGRKLSLVIGDDRLDAGTNRSETDKLMNEVFGFVGGVSVVDDGGADVLNGTNVADVGLSLGDLRIALPNNFSPNPINLADGGNGTSKMMAFFKANYGVTKAAVVYPAQAIARNRAKAYIKDLNTAGIPVAEEFEVAIAQTDYAGVASTIKNENIDLVITTLEISGMVRLAQALDQQDYTPKVPFYGAQAYGKKFISQAGAAAEGTVLGLAYSIFEDAPQVPAMQTFLTWYQRTNPGADIDFFAVQSWAAADMFVQALRAAGKDPTRDSVLAALKGLTPFDAGGLIAPVDPVNKGPASCFMVVTVEGGAWKRVTPPGKGFQC